MGSAARSGPGAVLAVLAIPAVAYALLQSLVSPALPNIQHALHASESGVTWVLTAFLLSAAICTPIVGRLGDMHGKRRTLLITLAILAIGTLVSAVSQSLGTLVAGRFVQGVGGGIFPLAFGIIRDEFPRERVAGSIGSMSALLGLGGGLGVVGSGLIVEHLSYRWLFWLPLLAVLASAVAVARMVPESPRSAPAPVNWCGAALMSVGLSAVLLAVTQTATWGWGSPKTLGLGAAGLVSIALWVRSELRSTSPLVDMRMMAIRGVWTTNLLAVMLGAGMFIAFVLLPQFVQTPSREGFGFGSSVVAAGLFLLPMALVMLAVGSVAGALERRFGSKALGLAGAVVSLLGFVVLLAAHGTAGPVYVASGLIGVGLGLAFAAMANLIVAAVPPRQTGVATGMNTVARSLGGAFGAQVGATLVAGSAGVGGHPTQNGYEQAFAVGAVVLVVAIVAAAAIPGRRRAGESATVADAEVT
jgi:EmrB/QacA subfamily drug resistance transporter